jgi:hypothetical protein
VGRLVEDGSGVIVCVGDTVEEGAGCTVGDDASKDGVPMADADGSAVAVRVSVG